MKTLIHKIVFFVFFCLLACFCFTSSTSYSSDNFFPKIGFYDPYSCKACTCFMPAAQGTTYWGQIDSAGLNAIVGRADSVSTRNAYGLKYIGQDTNLTATDSYGIPRRIAEIVQYGYDAYFEAEQTWYDSTKEYWFLFSTGENVDDDSAFDRRARLGAAGMDSTGCLISSLQGKRRQTSQVFATGGFEFHFRLKIADNSSSDTACRIEAWACTSSIWFKMDSRVILANEFQAPNVYQDFGIDSLFVGKKWELSCAVYWYGNQDLWVDQVHCYNPVGKLSFTLDPDSVEVGFGLWYQSINTDNFYRFYPEDEPPPIKYEIHGWFDNHSTAVPPNRPGCAVLNGFPEFVWPYVPYTQRPELFQNVYPLTASVDSASEGSNSLQLALNNFTDGIRPTATAANTQNVDFWFVVQAHAESSSERHLRDPQANEISAQVWLALAYGAKGIGYYHYPSWETDTSWNRGLVEWNEGTERYEPNYKWYAVRDINARLDSIDSILLALSWQDAGKGDSVVFITGSFMDSLKSSEFDSAWIEVGFFKDSVDADYFMLINRRCLSTEEQNVTVYIDNAQIGDETMWYVIDQYSQDTTFTGAIDGVIPFITHLDPGEGKIFKLASFTDSAFHGTAHPFIWQGGIIAGSDVLVCLSNPSPGGHRTVIA